MKKFKQIDENTIQTHETHADGSYTSGAVIRSKMRKDADGNEYEPWQKLIDDNEPVVWLTEQNIADTASERVAEQERSTLKSNQNTALDNLTVEVDGLIFQANDVSRKRMLEAIMAADFLSQSETPWIMKDNSRTTITLAQLKQAQALATQAMGQIVLTQ